MATAEQKQQVARAIKAAAGELLDAQQRAAVALQRYFDLSLEYSADDFTGDIAHMDVTSFTNALSTLEAINTLMAAGHRANLNKVR